VSASDHELRPLEVSLEECDGSFERMLRRFVRRTRDDGILAEVGQRSRGFVKPSQARRRKKIAPR
jgi:ribosomal protein S21